MRNCEIIEQEIAELEAKQIDYGTAEKLAWLYIVRDHIKAPKAQHMEVHETEDVTERYESKPDIIINEGTGSEFLEIIEGKNLDTVLEIIDETMSTLKTTLPRIYNNTMAKLYNI